MKRKIVFSVIVLCLLAILTFIGYKGFKTAKLRKQAEVKILFLPDLPFVFTKKTSMANMPVIVNYFSTSCEHCEYMATQFVLHQKEFEKSRILMITPDDTVEVNKFKLKFGIDRLDFVSIGIDSKFEFYKIFGYANTPSFFIYNKNHKFVKKYLGETKIQNLIKYAMD